MVKIIKEKVEKITWDHVYTCIFANGGKMKIGHESTTQVQLNV